MRKVVLAAAILAIAVALVGVSVVSLMVMATSPNGQHGSGALPGPNYPVFIGKPVLVLGDSPNTEGIVDRLLMSTDNVTVVANLGDLPQSGFDGVITVDGSWALEQPINDLATALAPFVLQGTPITLVNMTADVVDIIGASQDPSFNVGHSESDGVPIQLIGFYYRSSDGYTCRIFLGSGSPAGYFEAITKLYEWGTEWA